MQKNSQKLIAKAWLKLSSEQTQYQDRWVLDETWVRVAVVNDAPVTFFSLPSPLPMLLLRYFALFSTNVSNDSMA
jgi:hypothetical protein